MSRGKGKLKLNEKAEISQYKTGDFSLVETVTEKKTSPVITKKNPTILRNPYKKITILFIASILVLSVLFKLSTKNTTATTTNKAENSKVDSFNPNFSPFIKKQIEISEERNTKIGTILGNAYDMVKTPTPKNKFADMGYMYYSIPASNFRVHTAVFFDSSNQKKSTQTLSIELKIAGGIVDEPTFKKLITTFSDTVAPEDIVTKVKTACDNFKKKKKKGEQAFDVGNIHGRIVISDYDEKITVGLFLSHEIKDKN